MSYPVSASLSVPIGGSGDLTPEVEVTPPILETMYLGRQAIYALDGALHAYELLFRHSQQNRALIRSDEEATAHVIARAIGDIGLPQVLEGRTGYLNLNRDMLMSEAVLVVPPQRFVLEVLETVVLDGAAVARCAMLREYGFKLALDDVMGITPRLYHALPWIDIVKVDFALCDRGSLAELVAIAKDHGKVLLAEKIETDADFELARALGFDLVQGYLFSKPEVMCVTRASSSRQGLLKLLALLAEKSTLRDLEREMIRNPGFFAQTLRMGGVDPMEPSAVGARHVILANGTRQLRRWLQLLLLADGGSMNR